MVNEMKFYYKDYKNAIQIQGIIPAYDIDFYFSSKKQYEQFKEDYEFSQPKELKVQQALNMLPEYKKGLDKGRVEGAIEGQTKLINFILKNWNNIPKIMEDEGLEDSESYRLIDNLLFHVKNYIKDEAKEKRLKELEKGGKV